MSKIKIAELFYNIQGFKESKYSRLYEKLIQKALGRKIIDGYTETHHIVPRSFGGNNSKENLVRFTAREHYIAHLLLWKMQFPGSFGSKMSFAFCSFINKFKNKEHNYKITSRIYESFRKEYSLMLREKWKREGANFKGKTHSDETKKIIGEKSKLKQFKRGSDHPGWGKKANISEQGKLNRKIATETMWNDPNRREALLKKREAANKTPETILKRKAASDAKIGVKRDPSIVEKTASKKRGKKEHEIYSPEAILIRKEALKNRVLSEEAKERMRIGLLKACKMPKKKKPCPHCGKMCAGNMLVKWHGDNCKMKVNDEQN
jgi:hypothetical protein